jgi:prophage antirepressor-like protein
MNDSTNIIPFNFDSHPIRATVEDGQLWLHAGDICAALGIVDTSQAVERIPEKHKSVLNTGTPGRQPWFVTKPGAYRLILRSRKPEAERFLDWLTDEVIPAIEAQRAPVALPSPRRRSRKGGQR